MLKGQDAMMLAFMLYVKSMTGHINEGVKILHTPQPTTQSQTACIGILWGTLVFTLCHLFTTAQSYFTLGFLHTQTNTVHCSQRKKHTPLEEHITVLHGEEEDQMFGQGKQFTSSPIWLLFGPVDFFFELVLIYMSQFFFYLMNPMNYKILDESI